MRPIIQVNQRGYPHIKSFHVNFNLQAYPDLYVILSHVPGVEEVEAGLGRFLHKYHFSIIKGEVFEWADVEKAVIQKLNEYFE